MHQFECIHPYNACKQFDSGLLQKVGVLIVVTGGIGGSLGAELSGKYIEQKSSQKGSKQ